MVARPDARMVEVPLEIEAELPRDFEGAALLSSSGLPRKVRIKAQRDALKLSTAYRADQLLADLVRTVLRGSPIDVEKVQIAARNFVRSVRERRQDGATLTVESNGRGKIDVSESLPPAPTPATRQEGPRPTSATLADRLAALERRVDQIEGRVAPVGEGGDRVGNLEKRLAALEARPQAPGVGEPPRGVLKGRGTAIEAFADGMRVELRERVASQRSQAEQGAVRQGRRVGDGGGARPSRAAGRDLGSVARHLGAGRRARAGPPACVRGGGPVRRCRPSARRTAGRAPPGGAGGAGSGGPLGAAGAVDGASRARRERRAARLARARGRAVRVGADRSAGGRAALASAARRGGFGRRPGRPGGRAGSAAEGRFGPLPRAGGSVSRGARGGSGGAAGGRGRSRAARRRGRGGGRSRAHRRHAAAHRRADSRPGTSGGRRSSGATAAGPDQAAGDAARTGADEAPRGPSVAGRRADRRSSAAAADDRFPGESPAGRGQARCRGKAAGARSRTALRPARTRTPRCSAPAAEELSELDRDVAAAARPVPEAVGGDDLALATEVATDVDTEADEDPEWAQLARGPKAFPTDQDPDAPADPEDDPDPNRPPD